MLASLPNLKMIVGLGAGVDHLLRDPALPRRVRVDGGKLRQILVNLLGNAIKYTEHGGVVLRATSTAADAPDRARLRFEVEDTGPGIREEDRERIFLPFVQGGVRAPIEGSGLGLAICKEYVGLMGGTIGVEPRPDEGSIFHFEVPVAIAADSAALRAPGRSRVTGLAPGQPARRLLVAEDQPENRLLLHRLLGPLGFELRDASDGAEAIAAVKAWHPDLVWMDIRMPGMDGLEATRRIRALPQAAGTKIVALTAHALEDERVAIMAAGCDDFIRKPYRDAEVFDALARHLGVRFVHEEQAVPAVRQELPDPAALARVPAAVVDALERAVVAIDHDAVERAIGEIGRRDQDLGSALAAVARDLQYGRILRFVRAGRGGEHGAS